MTDISFTLEAKSDQLNAVDIMGADLIIKIRDVKVTKSDQPVAVYFEGDNNKPWKPSKGMRRILAGAWGNESSNWIGKCAKLYFEPSVRYAGEEVGGIRIRSLSHIDARGLKFVLTISSKKREPYHVPLLLIEEKEYPQDRFDKALPMMAEKMISGEMSLQQVIAQCQKTGRLTPHQLKCLEDSAPVEVDDENTHETDEEIM